MNVIVNGPYIPMHKFYHCSQVDLTNVENHYTKYDCNIKNNIYTKSLYFFMFINIEVPKNMWDTLKVTYEGTTNIKRTKIYTLVQEYDMFCLQQGETILDVQKMFTHIINYLIEVANILRRKVLDKYWKAKVIVIFK